MNLSDTLELYHKYQLSGMHENQIKAIFEGLDIRDKDVIRNKDLKVSFNIISDAIQEMRNDFKELRKDVMHLKLMLGFIILLTALPILKELIA